MVPCINVTKRHDKNGTAQNSFIVFCTIAQQLSVYYEPSLLLFYYDGERLSNAKNTEMADG